MLAAALLRQLHAVITTGRRWDPVIASGGSTKPAADRRLTPGSRRYVELAAGASPTRHRDAQAAISPLILGSPARRRINPITRCRAPSP